LKVFIEQSGSSNFFIIGPYISALANRSDPKSSYTGFLGAEPLNLSFST